MDSNNLISSPWDDPSSTDFIIGNGEIKTINPGSIRHFNNFIIEKGGKLLINNGIRKFTCIKVSGECKIYGTIEAKSHRSGGGNFTETAPDGEILEVILEEKNKGGNGGQGGRCRGFGSCTSDGGMGADGTIDYGGGGGSGAIGTSNYKPKCSIGVNATSINGAISPSAPLPSGRGGNGVARGTRVNGGYLYLLVINTLDVNNGFFDFRGSNGENGENGFDSGNSTAGSGGGGGGAPGGQGGTMYVKYNKLIGEFNFNASGGDGGIGGQGGEHFYSTDGYGKGFAGKNGERGFDGQLIELNFKS